MLENDLSKGVGWLAGGRNFATPPGLGAGNELRKLGLLAADSGVTLEKAADEKAVFRRFYGKQGISAPQVLEIVGGCSQYKPLRGIETFWFLSGG